ncbi:hypothetical protein C0J52_26472, partial [Blattella germanica]
SHRKISGSYPESEVVSNVVCTLDDAVAIDVGVTTSGDTVSSAHFLLLGVAVSISIAVLANGILSLVLARARSNGNGGSGMSYSNRWDGTRHCNCRSSSSHYSCGVTKSRWNHGLIMADAALLAVDVGKSLSVCSEMGSLGGGYFGGVKGNSSSDGGDGMGDSDGGGMSHSGGSRSYGQVGGSHTESIDGVGDVAGALHKTVAIDVGVSSSGDAVSGAGLGLGTWATGVSVAVLAQSVLSVVLAGHGGGDSYGGRGYCHVGGVGGGIGGGIGGGVTNGGRSSGSDGKVGSGHTEAKTISDVAGALDDAVAIDVGVSSSGDSVSGAHFLLLGVAVGVSVAVLAQSVLSVVLAGGGGGHSYGHGSHGVVDCHGGGMGYSQGGGGIRGGKNLMTFPFQTFLMQKAQEVQDYVIWVFLLTINLDNSFISYFLCCSLYFLMPIFCQYLQASYENKHCTTELNVLIELKNKACIVVCHIGVGIDVKHLNN